ncbi:hypothetical protein CP8484711_1319, partial [Chlamydia psittaci 84-8471/1]
TEYGDGIARNEITLFALGSPVKL